MLDVTHVTGSTFVESGALLGGHRREAETKPPSLKGT